MILGIVGIVVALFLFLFLVYRGYNVLYIAPICVLVVAVTNKISPLEAFTSTYVTGLWGTFTAIFSVIFLGTIFGKVMQDTGASTSIANIFTKYYIFKVDDSKKQISRAVLSLIVIFLLMTYGGIDAYTQIFVVYPVIMILAERLNLPRKVVPSFLVLNVAFVAAPGAPQIYNIISQGAFAIGGVTDTKVTYGLIPGLIAVAIIAVGGYFYSTYFAKKVKAKGETFDWNGLEKINSDDERKAPHIILAILPLVIVFVLYTIIGLDIAIALSAAIIVALVLMARYIEKQPQEKINVLGLVKRTLNRGADRSPLALLQLSAPAGFAAIITMTAGFGLLVSALAGLNINPILLTLITLFILTAVTSNPVASLMIAIPLILGILQAKGIDANIPAIFRVAALAATTFETLPFNGMPILCFHLTGTTHKEAYKPILFQTVLFTAVGAIVAAVIFLIAPGII